jgi:hypothetical protein
MKSNQVLTKGYQKDSIWGDVIIGASLGPIFSACSPTYFVILATVLPVSLFLGIVYLLAYVLGLSLSLVLIALLGEGIMARVGKVSDPRGWFKKIFGVIFILVAVGIITGYDKKLQISLLDAGFFDVTKVEQKLLDNSQSKNVEDDTSVVNDENVSTEDVILDKSETIKENRNEKFLTLAEKNKKYIPTPEQYAHTVLQTVVANDWIPIEKPYWMTMPDLTLSTFERGVELFSQDKCDCLIFFYKFCVIRPNICFHRDSLH